MLQVLASIGFGAITAAVITAIATRASRRLDAKIQREAERHDAMKRSYQPLRKSIKDLVRGASGAIHLLRARGRATSTSLTITSGGSDLVRENVEKANSAYDRLDELSTDLVIEYAPPEITDHIAQIMGCARSLLALIYLSDISLDSGDADGNEDFPKAEQALERLRSLISALDETWQSVDEVFERKRVGLPETPGRIERARRRRSGT